MGRSYRAVGVTLAVLVMLAGALLVSGLSGLSLLERASAAENGLEASDEAWDWRALGQEVFEKHCSPCHGMEGEGLAGVFPAFQGNEFVVGDAKTVVRVPMNGRGGMPSFRDTLSDEELAAVLSHIRNSWGNEADPITPDVVAEVRAE